MLLCGIAQSSEETANRIARLLHMNFLYKIFNVYSVLLGTADRSNAAT
jgi:hypothetical protein